MAKEISLQEGHKKERKRGFCVCDECGLTCSFKDKDIIESHISGKGCIEFRKQFGIPKGHKFGTHKAGYTIRFSNSKKSSESKESEK